METLKALLEEYDRLGDAAFSSAHDFTLRQRHLESWAAKARDAIAALVRENRAAAGEGPASTLPEQRR